MSLNASRGQLFPRDPNENVNIPFKVLQIELARGLMWDEEGMISTRDGLLRENNEVEHA
jgi:hypothetical protein